MNPRRQNMPAPAPNPTHKKISIYVTKYINELCPILYPLFHLKMKYYETTCHEYVLANRKFDLHPELRSLSSSMPDSLSQLGNMIFYGPSGVGKYTQFLRFMEKYSENRLKTEKMTSQTEKQTYTYHISDVHYEIDFALLGCESKKMWNECFFQIVDIISTKRIKIGIILCKNFHAIHSELLEVFYSYMQHCRALSIHIAFVLITEHVSFIPNSILQCCKVIPVRRPSSQLYQQFERHQIQNPTEEIGTKCLSLLKLAKPRPSKRASFELEPAQLLNLKEMRSLGLVTSPEEIPKDVFNIVCDNIIRVMMQHQTIDILDLRDNLYDILLYGLDITECLWYILNFFVESDILLDADGTTISEILNRINSFLKYYNNNYRPIYHLESIFIYLITRIFQK